MEDSYDINYSEGPDKWDEFVRSSPQRNIFSYTRFLNALGAKYDLVTCSKNGKIVAGAAILFQDGEPIQNIFSFTQYQGVLLGDFRDLGVHSRIPLEFGIVEFFLEELVGHYKKICLCQSWRFEDMRPFQWYNYASLEDGIFKVDLRYTAILTLNKYENIDLYLNSVRRARKRELHKAGKSFSVESIDDENVMGDLHRKTIERQGMQLEGHATELVKNITRAALENKFGRLTCVKFDGEPIAAFLSLFDDRTCFHLFAGNDPDYRDSGAGTMLVVDTIENAISQGLGEIDFVGVNSPLRSAYKLSFNPELRPFHVAAFSGRTL